MKILVVDDFRSQRRYTVDALEKVSATVVEAEDGKDGLEKAQNDVYDLILTDKEMPVMDGFEMSRAIREDSRNTETPIVMISSKTEDKARARQHGISGWLSKPVVAEDIFKVVNKFKESTRSSNNILILNDSTLQANTWMNLLEMPKFSYDHALSARDALSMMRKKHYQVVMTAYELPEIDGLTFTSSIRQDHQLKNIPVFMISSDSAVEQKATQSGVSQFFEEPLNTNIIRKKLKRAVR